MNNYFYLDHHNHQQGPISPERFAENGVTPNSLVWCTGMADWAPAYTVPELKAFFQPRSYNQSPPPPNGGHAYGNAPHHAYGEMHHQQNPYGRNEERSSQYGGYNNHRMPPRPDTYLLWSVLAMILCCIPTGIVAVVKATNVDTYYMSGNYNAALRASMGARQWCIISLILGLVTNGTAWSYLLV